MVKTKIIKMLNLTTIQVENELNKSKTAGLINTTQQLSTSNSEKQELKAMLREISGPIYHGLEIITATHSTLNVDLLPEISGDNGPNGAIIAAAGKPGSRVAAFGATFILSANGPYPLGTKVAALSSDDKVIYQTMSVLTGRRKAILDYIISGEKLSASDAKRCGIIDEVAQFKNKYSKKNVPTSVVPVPVTPAQIASVPVIPIAATQQPAPIQTDAVVPPTPKRRGRSKDTPTALAVA